MIIKYSKVYNLYLQFFKSLCYIQYSFISSIDSTLLQDHLKPTNTMQKYEEYLKFNLKYFDNNNLTLTLSTSSVAGRWPGQACRAELGLLG